MITPLGFKIIVRFARKPIWMPTAPSKLFRITEHKFYTDDEMKQIRELQDAYTYQKAAIQNLMNLEFYIPATKAGGLPANFVETEEQRDELLKKQNDIRNQEIALMKQEYFEQQNKILETQLLEEKFSRETNYFKRGQDIDKHVEATTADSFIVEENFEQKIEEAMDNPSHHEFFIDMSGRKNGKGRPRNKSVAL